MNRLSFLSSSSEFVQPSNSRYLSSEIFPERKDWIYRKSGGKSNKNSNNNNNYKNNSKQAEKEFLRKFTVE